MDTKLTLILVACSVGWVAGATAQETPGDAPHRLPAGAQVRIHQGGSWTRAYLARQEGTNLVLALPGIHPLAPPAELAVPLSSVDRLEIHVGKKRHALLGAAIGAVVLGLAGMSDPVDTSKGCSYQSPQPCSRAEAIAVGTLGGALLGAIVGRLVETDQWAPVARDAIIPAPPTSAELRAAPGGPTVPGGPRPPVRWTLRF
jgi:hypothetical protein